MLFKRNMLKICKYRKIQAKEHNKVYNKILIKIKCAGYINSLLRRL